MMQQTELTPFSSLLEGKVVVADTSSLLIAGTVLLSHIRQCELVIPTVVVTELEGKRSHSTLGHMARQWINLLEDLRKSHGAGLGKGAPVPETDEVSVRIEPNHSTQTSLPIHLQNGSVDSTILAVAVNLKADKAIKNEVVLLSNDTPMRLKATIDLAIPAFEFNSSVLETNRAYTARTSIHLTEEQFINLGLSSGNDYRKLESRLDELVEKPMGYHTLIDVFIETEKEPVMTLRLEGEKLHTIERKLASSKITGRTLEQDVALAYLKAPVDQLPVVSIMGSAGTGKTLLTVATALEEVKARNFQKIVVFRSLHEMGMGQEMGFLPGDVADKMGPWAGAIGDALDVISTTRKPEKKNEGPQAVEDRKKVAEKLAEMIEVSPITYLRGRSLSKSFIILDEAQNFSRTELLNIISRVGEGSKLVILADSYQVDNRFLQAGDKADIWSVIRGFQNDDIFAHVTLTKTERSRLAELASRMLENGI